MKSLSDFIVEKAPPGAKAESWILANKERFQKEYGDEWEQILYATAWKMFGKGLNEDTSSPTVTTDGVANPDSKPLFKSSKFAGIDCIEVDSDTYMKCKFGKKSHSRWNGVIEDENLRSFVQKHYYKSSKLIVSDSKTGAMTYLKR
jgi:hypothetical protein